jgi:hypothetical protein
LQLYFEAAGNVIRRLQLSQLKLGLELKQKFAPKSLFLNNSTPHFWSEKILSFTIVEFEGLAKLGLELKQKYPPKPQIPNNSTLHFWSDKILSFTLPVFEEIVYCCCQFAFLFFRDR